MLNGWFEWIKCWRARAHTKLFENNVIQFSEFICFAFGVCSVCVCDNGKAFWLIASIPADIVRNQPSSGHYLFCVCRDRFNKEQKCQETNLPTGFSLVSTFGTKSEWSIISVYWLDN